MLLGRVNGAPSVRVIFGTALAPLSEAEAQHLDLTYLYKQGYLEAGRWTRPQNYQIVQTNWSWSNH